MQEYRSDKSQQCEAMCIDTRRVLDSCRDKDCFENTEVILTGYGKETLASSKEVRAKVAKVLSCIIGTDEVPFNCGFYKVSAKIFVKVIFEVCIGGCFQDIEGLGILEKNVILFGGEGNTKIFKSDRDMGLCKAESTKRALSSTSLPIAVLETVDPIVLDTKVVKKCDGYNGISMDAGCLPNGIETLFSGELISNQPGERCLVATFGLFSVVRLERPSQIVLSAAEYSVPEKDRYEIGEEDPKTVFREMPFPFCEFGIAPISRQKK